MKRTFEAFLEGEGPHRAWEPSGYRGETEAQGQRWSWVDTTGPGLWLYGSFPDMSTCA